jgi:enoyl-CoA hydratase
METIKYEKQDNIAIITLARPGKRNALNLQVFKELEQCLDDADNDKTTGALIITGGDKVFCAGMDISEMQSLKHDEVFPFWNYGYNIVFEKIYNFRVPTIAAVSGYALAGGFDLAVSCDFRIVDETAKFGQLEIDLGLSPGIERLWRVIGLSRAKYLGMTGEIIDAREAFRIGLADKLVDSGSLQKKARALAARFAGKPGETLEKVKQSYLNVVNMDHKAAIEWETALLSRLFDTEERRRIMARFLEKGKH